MHLPQRLLALIVPLALATACGGGGTAASTTQGAQVQGKVIEQGSNGAGRSGIQLTCLATGEVTWTASDGSFEFEVPSGEPIRVRISTGTAPAGASDWSCGEGDDEGADGVDADGTGVDLAALSDGEVVHVEIELRDGAVVECWLGAPGEGAGGAGECPLLPDPTLPPSARGELEAVREGGCLRIELEVEGLEQAQTLTAELIAAGGQASLGSFEVSADGAGHLEAVVCADDLAFPDLPPPPEGTLPPGTELPTTLPTVPELDPLFGATVLVTDADGRVLFVGILPGPGLEPGEAGSAGLPTPEDLPDLGDLEDALGGLPPLPPDLQAILDDILGLLPVR